MMLMRMMHELMHDPWDHASAHGMNHGEQGIGSHEAYDYASWDPIPQTCYHCLLGNSLLLLIRLPLVVRM